MTLNNSTMIKFSCLLISLLSAFAALAETGQHRYEVALLRAAPGEMPELIEAVQQRKEQSDDKMLIMRHSQGDHWDLMLLMPAPEGNLTQHNYNQWADFQHNFTAVTDISWETLASQARGANLFHIEMFQAARGLLPQLLEQRRMENNYLSATARPANLIFITEFGSDVDVFTLGIYPDLAAFAAEPDLPAEAFEKAAQEAGFKARSDIGFYLRRFLVGHQDTLATQIE